MPGRTKTAVWQGRPRVDIELCMWFYMAMYGLTKQDIAGQCWSSQMLLATLAELAG